MKVNFKLVDCGCYMYEADNCRWIIQHPKNGYLKTYSNLWDVVLQHPEEPNKMPLKLVGSFETKKEAVSEILNKLATSIDYFNFIGIENKFYTADYSKKINGN